MAQSHSMGQHVSLSYPNIRLQDALELLQEKYGLAFSYSNEGLPLNKKVDLEAQNEPLEQVMNRLFGNSNIAYRKIGGHWVLKNQTPSLTQREVLTQTIRGVVRDMDTHLPLSGASVVIPALERGAYTDKRGHFRIEGIPVGRHELNVSYLGYKGKSLQLVLHSAKQKVLTLDLLESPWEMESVVIKENKLKKKVENEISPISARVFSVEETNRFAGSLDNPAFMVTAFAGVRGGEDVSDNELVIRGNMPRLLQWQLEGIEIPSPNHFTYEGGSTGPISIISSNMLTYSQFYSGAFSAEYGNAIAGIFDISLRNGNNKENEFALGASMLGVDFAAEGPLKIGEKASYLANYRYSSLALLNDLGMKILPNETPKYQDFSFKVHIPTRRMGTFDIFGLGGLSNSDYSEGGFDPYLGREVNWTSSFYSNMGVLGLKHYLPLDEKLLLTSSLSLSGYDIGDRENIQQLGRDYKLYESERFKNINAKATVNLNYKPSNQHFFKAGLISTLIGYDLFAVDGVHPDQVGKYLTDINAKGKTHLIQAYANWRFSLNEKLSFNTGLHYMDFQFNGHSSLEPRLSIKWKLNSRQSLSAGFGLHSRRQAFSTYFVQTNEPDEPPLYPNRNLDFIRAEHYGLAFDQQFKKQLHLKLEGYYQRLHNIPVLPPFTDSENNGAYFPMSFINIDQDYIVAKLINEGDALNYGLELTLEKFYSNSYYFMLTSSVFQSKYSTFSESLFNTRFNTNFIHNILGGKEFKFGKNLILNGNVRLIWSGGKRYTPIDISASQVAGYTIRDWDRPYLNQNKDYFRMDASIGVNLNQKKFTHQWKIDVRNATNRAYEEANYYDVNSQSINSVFVGRLIPVVSYKILF